MKHFQITGFIAGTVVLGLALAACSGVEQPAPDPQSQAASAPAQAGSDSTQVHPGVAHFIQRFDDDGNGTLEVSELPPGMAEHMADADSDGDGVLTAAELGQAFEARMKAHFAKMDKDGDGALSESEVNPRHWNHLVVADANGDGKVTAAEIQTAHANGTLKPPAGGGRFRHGMGGKFFKGPKDPASFVKRFDANQDGTLELTELPEPMQERLAEADTDGDGALSTAELTVHHEARMKAHFAKMDKNGDSALSADEVGARRWQHMSVADADGDGKLTEAEFQKAHADGTLGPPMHHRGMMRGPGPR